MREVLIMDATDRNGKASVPGKRLPPGQYASTDWPVVHYGPVPRFDPETWRFRVFGETASGREHIWTRDQLAELPGGTVIGDMHCVTRFSALGNRWAGIPAAAVLDAAPPAADVSHVMVWAEYGYSANLRLPDFAAETTLLATHRDGSELGPEHGFPLRLVVPHLYAWKSVKWLRGVEYLTEDRRGFWEDRGYHNRADPWSEQRYAYQETPDDGPPLLRGRADGDRPARGTQLPPGRVVASPRENAVAFPREPRTDRRTASAPPSSALPG